MNALCRIGLRKQASPDLVHINGLCLGTAAAGSAYTGPVLQQTNWDPAGATKLAGIGAGVTKPALLMLNSMHGKELDSSVSCVTVVLGSRSFKDVVWG